MKFLALATSCVVGFAAALPQGSLQRDALWTVTGLSVHSTPAVGGSLTTTYALNITTSTQSAQCNAISHQGKSPMGTLPKTACVPAAFSFSWTPKRDAGANGGTLKLFGSTTKQHANHAIPASEIKQSPLFVFGGHPYSYSGHSSFVVNTQLD